jgi:soluble lytic murein transglycosylase-like protein
MLLAAAPFAHAMERVTLSTGFSFDCTRREPIGDRIRLYLAPAAPWQNSEANYIDVPAAEVVAVETVPDPPPAPVAPKTLVATAAAAVEPTAVELRELLSHAGEEHNIDAELLASVVHAESGGHARAVSRTGAQGLMQLMPGTASAVGVKNAFVAAENVEGGTRYLDQMLTRYHDNIALALAAYNAGPGAVDRYRGIPPFRETRAYVARVIREFNRRKTEALSRSRTLLAKGQ